MIVIHHFTWFLMGSLGLVTAFFLSKFKWTHDFRYLLLFFSIGVFIHIFLVDYTPYQHIYEEGISCFDLYMVQGRKKNPAYNTGGVVSLLEMALGDPWTTTYVEHYEKKNLLGD